MEKQMMIEDCKNIKMLDHKLLMESNKFLASPGKYQNAKNISKLDFNNPDKNKLLCDAELKRECFRIGNSKLVSINLEEIVGVNDAVSANVVNDEVSANVANVANIVNMSKFDLLVSNNPSLLYNKLFCDFFDNTKKFNYFQTTKYDTLDFNEISYLLNYCNLPASLIELICCEIFKDTDNYMYNIVDKYYR